MLFITNRIPVQSARSKAGRAIRFDYQNTDVSKWLYFCERHGEHDYTEILSSPFFDRLKALPAHTQLLFYIHGFNNNMEPHVFHNAQRLESLINNITPDLVKVIPLIWPCDDDSVVKIMDDYWDDQKAADFSAIAFSRLLDKFDHWRRSTEQQAVPCLKRMNLLAHSMGNRVLVNTLHYWVEGNGYEGVPMLFRNVFMVAPDVDNAVLESGHRGQHVLDSCKNTLVYYASDDYAMPASKIANLRHRMLSRRLGMTGPANPHLLPSNRVFSFDCDSFNNRFDYPTGHSYFLNDADGNISPIISHIAQAIQFGRVSDTWEPLLVSA